MSMLPVRKLSLSKESLRQTVILGPCPGCDDWQIDYLEGVGVEPAELEAILRDHYWDCPHLRDLLLEKGFKLPGPDLGPLSDSRSDSLQSR